MVDLTLDTGPDVILQVHLTSGVYERMVKILVTFTGSLVVLDEPEFHVDQLQLAL